MTGSTAVDMGEQGEIFIPADMLAARGWPKGTELILVETDDGLLVAEPLRMASLGGGT
jgi:bifunctional DNA-binding transcriptional regulator/antitoxin component of YhaV-PrlF toxin-antitoxin module